MLRPSARTINAWRKHVAHPCRTELCIIAGAFFTSWFALASSVMVVEQYIAQGSQTGPQDIFYNFPSYASVATVVYSSNLCAPFVTMGTSAFNLYLYARHSLNPWYSVAYATLMTIAWGVSLAAWVLPQVMYSGIGVLYGINNERVSHRVAVGVVAPKFAGGLFVAFTCFAYFVISVRALTDRRCGCGAAPASISSGPKSLPDYEDIMLAPLSPPAERASTPSAAPAPAYADGEGAEAPAQAPARDQKRRNPDACYCASCVAGDGASGSSVHGEASEAAPGL